MLRWLAQLHLSSENDQFQFFRLKNSLSGIQIGASDVSIFAENVSFFSKNQCLAPVRSPRRPGTIRSTPNHLPTISWHFTIEKTLSAWFTTRNGHKIDFFTPNLKSTQVYLEALKPAKMCVFPRKINVWYLFDPQGAQERPGAFPITYQPCTDTLQSGKHSRHDLTVLSDLKTNFSNRIWRRHRSANRHSNRPKCVFLLEKCVSPSDSVWKVGFEIAAHG